MKLKQILSSVLASALLVLSLSACSVPDDTGNSGGANQGSPGASGQTTAPTQTEQTTFEIVQNTCDLGINSIGTAYLRCIVVIKNTGSTNMYLSTSKFDIEDESGKLIATADTSAYPNVIMPGENAVFCEYVKLDENADINIKYAVVPKIEAKKARVPVERLPVTDFTLSEDKYFGFKYIGRVENTTNEVQSHYTLAVILYGSDGKVIGADFTYPDKLAPGEKTSFESGFLYNYFGITLSDIARYEVIAFTYQLQF